MKTYIVGRWLVVRTECFSGFDEVEVHLWVGEEKVKHAVDWDGEDVIQWREAVVLVTGTLHQTAYNKNNNNNKMKTLGTNSFNN